MSAIVLVISICIVLVIAVGVAFVFIIRLLKKPQQKEDNSSLLLLQNQIQELSRVIDSRLHESSRFMQTQYGESHKIIKDVTDRLAKLDETNRQVVGFADQLQSLQDILKNPKQRGIVGEYYLETLLKNVLPPGSYEMQYHMGRDDEGKELIVDAVVFVKDKIIPIDSKFSLENYNRLVEERDEVERARLEKKFIGDLKLRIEETSKYIRPEQNTMEFAFMFIPHEAIYYDLLINKIGALKDENTESLIQRAAGKYKVIIVSPTSFLAYLQTVLQGLKAMQIEESAKEIRKRVEELGKHIGAHDQFMQSLGKSLETTVNHYNKASKELGKIDKDVLRITGTNTGVEPLTLITPERDE